MSEENACAVEEDIGQVGNAWKSLEGGSLTAAFVGRQSYSSTNRLRCKLTQLRSATFCINKKGNVRKSVTLLAHLFCYCPCKPFRFLSNIFRVGQVLW